MTEEAGISVVAGHVRIGLAATWDEARGLLREQVIYRACPAWHDSCPASSWRDRQVAAIEAMPRPGAPWITVGDGTGGVIAWAQQGRHGLAAGDEAWLHDYHDPGARAWTTDVRCEVTTIGAEVTVRTLEPSAQLPAGELVTVPRGKVRRHPADQVTGRERA